MKQLLTLTLLFTITNGYGQKISKSDTAIMPLSSPRFIKMSIDEGDYWTFKQSSTQARIKANSDTLEIIGNSIKFIKIDGKTYEIKRNTELKEVKPNWAVSFGEVAIRIDTTLGIRSHNKPAKQ